MLLKVVVFALLLSTASSAVITCDQCIQFIQYIDDALGDGAKTASIDQIDRAVMVACRKEFGPVGGLLCITDLVQHEAEIQKGLQDGEDPQLMCQQGHYC